MYVMFSFLLTYLLEHTACQILRIKLHSNSVVSLATSRKKCAICYAEVRNLLRNRRVNVRIGLRAD